MATLSHRAFDSFASPLPKHSENDWMTTEIPNSSIWSSFPGPQSYPHSPLRSPKPLTARIPTHSPAFPPAHFVDVGFKKPKPSKDTPRQIIKSFTQPDSEQKTPRKLIESITTATPLSSAEKKRLDKLEMEDKEIIRPTETNADIDKLYELISNLNREVKYLESVKDTLTKVLEDTERDRANIQNMAQTVAHSDVQLAAVDHEIIKLKEDIRSFHFTVQEAKKDQKEYFGITQLVIYFVIFMLVAFSLVVLGTVLSHANQIFSDDPIYYTLTPRPT